MSPVQQIIYRNFERMPAAQALIAHAESNSTQADGKGERSRASTPSLVAHRCCFSAVVACVASSVSSLHVFQALHFLRKLCSHPLMVMACLHLAVVQLTSRSVLVSHRPSQKTILSTWRRSPQSAKQASELMTFACQGNLLR
jgi:hypothetical protein